MADSNLSPSYWGYLITPNKTAAASLEQLCLGLYQVIVSRGALDARVPGGTDKPQCRLTPGPGTNLTPQRLAAFYRDIGANFDDFFLNGSSKTHPFNSSLSLIYRTLGCYHTLEPTVNPFETPCIPALTPTGFVRWQTIQILLCPDDHATFLQTAVRKYDILRPDGTPFPKQIPRDAFPSKVDDAMLEWYEKTKKEMGQNYQRAPYLRHSPYTSPEARPYDRIDYFGSGAYAPGRRSRSSRERSSDRDRLRPALDARRSSVPELPSPPPPPPPPSTTIPRRHEYPYSKEGRIRSQSAKREYVGSGLRPRSATHDLSPAAHSRTVSSSSSRPPRHSKERIEVPRPYPYSRAHSGRQQDSASPFGSSSDDYSDNDDRGSRRRRRRSPAAREKSGISSLVPDSFKIFSSKRRHSHDVGSYRPRKDESASRRRDDDSSSSRHTRSSLQDHNNRPSQVHFSEADRPGSDRRAAENNSQDPRSPPSARHSEPYQPWNSPAKPQSGSPIGQPMSREQSNGSTDRRSGSGSEMPLRVQTVTSVSGRKFAVAEPNGSGPLPILPLPTSLPGSAVPGQDNRARYSMAT